MYASGMGVPQDYSQALGWFQKAADQGSAAALLSLGVIYYQGEGVLKDSVKALEWFKKSADADPSGVLVENTMAHIYATGDGVPKDLGKAMEWYRRSADQGNAQAENAIAQDVCQWRWRAQG